MMCRSIPHRKSEIRLHLLKSIPVKSGIGIITLNVQRKMQAFVEADRKITRIAEKAYKEKNMVLPEYRHRAIIWGVQSQYYTEFLPWLQNCWGILPLTDMLSMVSTRVLSEDDKEQAIYDMAWLNQNMIMRNRTHGGY